MIVGTGPLERRLRAAAAELPVTFLDPPAGPPEAAALLATVDVLLSPAPGGTFGMSALRALACGTPVVGTRSGALVDLVGVAGLDGRDRSVQASGGATWSHPAAFATAVTDLAALPTSERRLSARALAERFPWQATVDRMLALHRGGQRPPRAADPPPVAVGSVLASGRSAS